MKNILIASVIASLVIGSIVWACPPRAQVKSCPKPVQIVPPKVIKQEVIQAPAPVVVQPPAVQRELRTEIIPQPPVTVTERTYQVPQPSIQRQFVTESFQAQTFSSSFLSSAPVFLAVPVQVQRAPFLQRLFHRHGCRGGSVGFDY